MARKTPIENTTDRLLLTALVCPLSGAILALSDDGRELISRTAKLAFPIRDGIPIMLVGEARKLGEDEVDR